MEHLSEEVRLRAERLQKECHLSIDAATKMMNPDQLKKIKYQDLTNSWVFIKLAYLEKEIERLKARK